MRRILIGLALAALALPAWAQSLVEPYANLGNAYVGKGDYDRAIAAENQAIRLDPSNALAYYNRGLAYAGKGDYDLAIADLTQTIRLSPNLGPGYSYRGRVYEAKGLRDLAIADYRAALKLDPTDDETKKGLARLGVAP